MVWRANQEIRRMLRISKIIDYGTLVLTHMAGSPDRVFSAADLAGTLGLGQPTVSKVLKLLSQHELVRSSRGSRGGYALGRAPHAISIANIIDALEEQPFGLTECASMPGSCSVEAGCHIRNNWQRINSAIRRTLEDVSVADMLSPTPIEFPLLARPLPESKVRTRAVQSTTWSFPE
jgi:FeS assembly SUF system regulator